MDWIGYVLIALIAIFLGSKMLPVKGLKNLSSEDVSQLLPNKQGHLFVDVREPFEYQRGHIKGFVNLPLSQLRQRVKELDVSKPIVLTCQSGMRSRQAAKVLQKHGFTDVSHLATGMSGWKSPVIGKGSDGG